jgi:hypothetical protein
MLLLSMPTTAKSRVLTDILDDYPPSYQSGVLGSPYRGCRYAREDAWEETASDSYREISFRGSPFTNGNDITWRLLIILANLI